jgi:hypothetical protein
MAFEPELATTLWSASNVWMEFSNQTKPASVSSILSYELGENLRSNAVGARGGDNYAFMRELNAGDPVIHLVKTKGISWKIVGISFVKHRHVKRIGANGKYFYFIKLKYFVDFRKTSDCVSLNDIVSLYKKEIRQDAIENKSFFYPFILRKGVIVPAQRYISLTSRKLLSFILEILSGDREYEKFVGVDSDIDEIRREARTKGTSATTVNRLIDARLGQGKFRSDLEAEWNDQCAVLGLTTRALLRASHIKPWSQSTDSERLDPANGILLAAHIDALFIEV